MEEKCPFWLFVLHIRPLERQACPVNVTDADLVVLRSRSSFQSLSSSWSRSQPAVTEDGEGSINFDFETVFLVRGKSFMSPEALLKLTSARIPGNGEVASIVEELALAGQRGGRKTTLCRLHLR